MSAIRHAIISLGALNQSLSLAPSPSLKVNVIQTLEKNHHEQAVLHYHKAIQLLNQYISDSSSPQIRTALIACILFVCFETIQGSFASSIQQTYGGLKLLRSYYRGRAPLESNKKKMTESSDGDLESFDGNENDSVISAQVRAYFESDAWHEAPQLSLSTPTTNHRDFATKPLVSSQPKYQTWQADYLLQPPTLMSNQTRQKSQARKNELADQDPTWSQDSLQFQFQVGIADFTEPDYQKNRSSSFARQVSTDSDQRLSVQPPLKSSLKRSYSEEMKQSLPVIHNSSDTSFNRLGTENTRYRSMSTVSLNDNSSAYSSDSSSYREPSPHYLQTNTNTTTLRSSSLSTSFSQLEYNKSAPPKEAFSQAPSSSSSSATQPLLQRTLEIEDSIIQTFVRLDGPGIFFGMAPGIPVIYWDIHHTFHLPIPTSFPSHSTAQHCWDFLMDRALHFCSTTLYNRINKPKTASRDAEIARKHKEFVDEIAAFKEAFEPLLTAASSPTTFHAPTLLTSLYVTSTLIFLVQTISPSEMTYDNFLPGFTDIVSTCSLLLTIPPHLTPQPNSSSRFSFSIGIVPPLHLTATKCRDPHVRRQAIELLFRSQRQEGLWDGILCGRVGRWVMGCEEEGMEPFDIAKPEDTLSRFKDGNQMQARQGSEKEHAHIFDNNGQNGNLMTLPQRGRKPGQNTNNASNLSSNNPPNPEKQQDQKEKKKWIIPLENRTQLTSISFYIPDCYIKVKCQRVGGGKEVRETVIAW